MTKGINPIALLAGLAVILTAAGVICLNTLLYAMIDTEPDAEATPVEHLITKADF